MKNLTDTQKKWALTACLSALLSFNMIVALSGPQYSVADLASHEEEQEEITTKKKSEETMKLAKIATEKGLIDVRYTKSGDKTFATIPKRTQGRNCWEECGQHFLLDQSFNSNKEDLEVALRAAIAKAKAKHIEAKDGASTDLDVVGKRVPRKEERHEKDVVEEADEMHPDLMALQDRCDSKDDESRMRCFANGLTSLLSRERTEVVNGKRKKKNYKQSEVMSIYKTEIESPLITALVSKDEDTQREAQDTLADMIGSVTKGYGYLRERLSAVAARSVARSYQEAQTRLKMAESMKTTNPQAAMSLMYDGYMKRNMATQLAGSLDYTLISSLDNAYSNQYITSEQAVNVYNNEFARIVQPIIQGMSQQPLTYTISANSFVDANGNITSLAGNSGLNILNVSSGPVAQSRNLGNGIVLHTNGLTSANVMPTSAPLIMNNGQAGSARIEVIPLNQVPGISTTTFPALQNATILPQNSQPIGGQFAPVPAGGRGRGH